MKHFPSIDHAILRQVLQQRISEPEIRRLIDLILASGEGVLDGEYEMVWFAGDDLLTATRPRGLPIGNLTSQFWSNCMLHPFDQFVTRELGCPAYLRYVDDFALFSDDKGQLYEWRAAIIERLARLRLTIHIHAAHALPCVAGIPWLGFVVYPDHIRVKARKVRYATRRLHARLAEYLDGGISFASFDATVQGWINHVRFADSWGLREHVLRDLTFVRRPEKPRR